MASLECYSTRTLFLLAGVRARGGGTENFFLGKRRCRIYFGLGRVMMKELVDYLFLGCIRIVCVFCCVYFMYVYFMFRIDVCRNRVPLKKL